MHPEGLRFDPAWLHQLPAGSMPAKRSRRECLFCNNSVKDMASAKKTPGRQRPGRIIVGEMYAVT